MSLWNRHIKNPTQPLRTGRIPNQNTAQRASPRVLGWRVEDRDSFVAAFAFSTVENANSEKPEIEEWVKRNLEPRFGKGLEVILKAKTLIVIRPGTDVTKLETTKDGSPYYKGELRQTRSSDEGETRFVEDLLTGKEVRENPPTDVIITVPHAKDDKVDDGHDTDWNAEKASHELANALLEKGIDPIVMIGEDNRDIWDLNREHSSGRPFHIALNKNLKNADILLDIHSYPAEYEGWGDYDVVLFAFGPFHTEEDNNDTMELAKWITEECPDTKVLIDQADMIRNYIQHKGMIRDIESHLIEVVEGKDPKPAMKAVANYITGTKRNIPTVLPEGAAYQQFTLKLNLKEKTTLLELLEIEMEDLGFPPFKHSYFGSTSIVERTWFKLPTGFPQEPTLMFARNTGVVYLYRAQFLNNKEVQSIYEMINEAVESQPEPNPKDDNKESKLNRKSSESEIKEALKKKKIDPPVNAKGKLQVSKALQLAAGYVDKDSSNEDIEAELKKRKKKIPKKSDGKGGEKLDRAKALEMVGAKESVEAMPSLPSFGSSSKNERMKLSTSVTRMVVSQLLPGAHTIKEEGKGKGGQVDAAKVRNLDAFKKLPRAEKNKLLPKGKAPNWGEIKKKFGDKDIYKNPPKLCNTPNKKKYETQADARIAANYRMRLGTAPHLSTYKCKGCGFWHLTSTKTNPPVTVDPEQGKFSLDITGRFVKNPSIVVTANGEASKLNIGELAEPQEGEYGREQGRLVRVNMFRQKAGFKIKGQKKQPKYIISIETAGKHFYAEREVKIHGFAELKHFPDKKSEPRLRVETRGKHITVWPTVGDGKGWLKQAPEKTVIVRGKEHPLYDNIHIYQKEGDKYATESLGLSDLIENPTLQKTLYGEAFRDELTEKEEKIEALKVAGHILMDLPKWMKDKELQKLGAMRVSKPENPLNNNWLIPPEAEPIIEGMIEKKREAILEEARKKAEGTARLDEFKRNSPAYAEQYVKDHELMTPKEEKKFTKIKLKGKIGSPEFFEQIASKVQVFGEGQGWVRDGYLYWKKGPGHLNYVEVDGHMLEGGTAWMHTHPAAWEPSQSSPDDFKVMHGLFINHGVRDFFTIIADRIDWFRAKKKDRIPLEEMLEVIDGKSIVQHMEEDIDREFHIAEEKFQRKMGDKPYLTSEQTRYITNHFNKVIDEFEMSYKAYALSPQQVRGRIVSNPPPTVAISGFFK
tara:strand:- start:729 stop:4340 length:3612 start_codon:yes stop_codon:yes gene_type:complete